MKKLNVGADASVRPLTQTGITLIALIITIIVMLILVGVTINVALNGGLFDKAKTASEQTQRETDKEQLLSAVIETLNNDGTVNEEELQAHLPDNFKYENGVYKNKVTGKEYTVDSQTGKVTEATSTNSGSTGNQENSGNTGGTETVKNLIPNEAQLADAGEPETGGGMTSYFFDKDLVVGYSEYGSDVKFVNISDPENSDYTYEWACNEETATSMGYDACYTWYVDGEVYDGPCPISLETLNEPKNTNGYITDVINSFNK